MNSKISVMIIDDDRQVRERLKDIIDWEGLSLCMICEAGDSDTARELFLMYHPRIIITDIKIPIISGLELAQELTAIDSDIRFIVITGYNAFTYAQQSVKLGAIDLLLKPILPQNINESLMKAVEYFKQRRSETASLQALQALVDGNLPALQERYFLSLLSRKEQSQPEIENRLSKLNIHFSGHRFAVAIVTADTARSADDAYEAMGILLRDTVGRQFGEAGFAVYAFFDDHSRLNCILNWSFEDGDNRLEETLDKAVEQMLFIADIKVCAGIGRTVTDLSMLCESCREAKLALNCRGVFHSDAVIHYKNIQLGSQPPASDSIWDDLIQKFRLNDYHAISESVSKHVYSLFSSDRDCERRLRAFIFRYVSVITSESIRLGLDVEETESFAGIINKLFTIKDTSVQLTYVLELTGRLLALLSRKLLISRNYLVKKAKEYINENLQDDTLSLDIVSSHVGLSRIYFCKLFHKEEGLPFNSYLNQVRVERAKQLLVQPGMKLFEISAATGFANPKYFGYVFRKVSGMTPLEYQKQALEGV